ncbi:CCC motif membrane protein [Capnocytophaga canis]|uniref:DUF4190 domain-containing protein n=1 Tax=Capnocytophaga canis TaxID=1848903 RepID=A0A0B7IRG6_9FLAO|nr:CCC motif membrane protein [Capnocytophaga canis]CEN54496.1 conserved hypothetical protein [Capnocytophaga canis]
MDTNQNPTFNYNKNPIFDQRSEFKQPISATVVYVLAIIGIVFSFCCGVGLIPAVIAVLIASTRINQYNSNPEMYLGIDNLKTARTVAYISVIISVLMVLLSIYLIAIVGLEGIEQMTEEMPYNHFD